jgi:hypothetical protein
MLLPDAKRKHTKEESAWQGRGDIELQGRAWLEKVILIRTYQHLSIANHPTRPRHYNFGLN